jgi:hypothetical protein
VAAGRNANTRGAPDRKINSAARGRFLHNCKDGSRYLNHTPKKGADSSQLRNIPFLVFLLPRAGA